MAEAPADGDLITLAKNHFTNVSPGEEEKLFEEFFGNTAIGVETDRTRGSEAENNPVNAGEWKRDRITKAEWLVWLCIDPQASAKVTSRGLIERRHFLFKVCQRHAQGSKEDPGFHPQGANQC